jgi:hypothetical protein
VVKLEKEFVVERERDEIVGAFDDDATFEAILPDTRIVKGARARRASSSPRWSTATCASRRSATGMSGARSRGR